MSRTNAFLICAFRSADILRWCLSPERNLTHNLFFYFQLFLVLIWLNFSMRRAVQPEIRWFVLLLRAPFMLVNSAVFMKGGRGANFWQGNVQKSSPILRCTFLSRKTKLIANFSTTMMTSLPSLSVSLSHQAHLTHNMGSDSALPVINQIVLSISDLTSQFLGFTGWREVGEQSFKHTRCTRSVPLLQQVSQAESWSYLSYYSTEEGHCCQKTFPSQTASCASLTWL